MSEWLIHQHYFRIVCISSRDPDTLSHTSGKTVGITVLKPLQPYQVYKVLSTLPALFFPYAPALRAELYISHHCAEWKECGRLIYNAAIRSGRLYLFAVYVDLSCCGKLQTCDQVDHGRLAALTGSKKNYEFIFFYIQAHVPHHFI